MLRGMLECVTWHLHIGEVFERHSYGTFHLWVLLVCGIVCTDDPLSPLVDCERRGLEKICSFQSDWALRQTGLGNLSAGRISYLDVDPFEPSKCFGIEGRRVGAMFVLHPSAEIMLKFSYHHQVDGMVSLLLLLR